MPFAAALSLSTDTVRAVDEVCSDCLGRLGTGVDLAFLFFSAHHLEKAALVGEKTQSRLQARCFLGCPGEAIVGGDKEIEGEPAMSLWAARFPPATRLQPFHLELQRTPEGHSILGWPDRLADVDPARSAILLLGDPFSFPVDAFLGHVNEEHPGLRVMGGMASGIREPGACRLLLGGEQFENGAIGVLLEGPVGVRSIVSQGCRPIGRHMVVTRGKNNIIAGLGGKPALAQLQDLWQELSSSDRALCEHGLHIGRVINEYQGEFRRGDFLVRNIQGLDQDSGSMAINDLIRVGQTVQFHVRDAETADEDLRALLCQQAAVGKAPPGGALLFTCNGRGTRLFSKPHHDAQAVREEVGETALAGFFAQGELGPVGGQNFIHGFTASIVLFDDKPAAAPPAT